MLPEITQLATRIEFIHRLSSGLAFLSVVGLCLISRKIFPNGHKARKAAGLSLLLIILEAGIGARLVLFKLVAENNSAARAVSISVHLVNTYLLLVALTLTAYWSKSTKTLQRRNELNTWLLGIAGIALIILGMTGAVTALGDTFFPPSSIEEGLAQDLY